MPALACVAVVLGYRFLPQPAPVRSTVFIALQLFGGAAAWTAFLIARRMTTEQFPLRRVIAVAILARLACVGSEPIFENDLNRYVWDARVFASGENPYRYPPAHPELAPLTDDQFYPNIPFKVVPTIYPPLAELTFLLVRALGGERVIAFQLAMALVELLSIYGLWRLLKRLDVHPSFLLLYAWNPVPIKEFVNSAHIDACAVTATVWGLVLLLEGRRVLSGVALGAGVLFKVYPLVAVPSILRASGPRVVITLALVTVTGYAAFAWHAANPLLGLAAFARYWIFNPSVYDLAARLLMAMGRDAGDAYAEARAPTAAIGALIILALGLRAIRAPEDVVARIADAFAVLLLFSPAANAWYIAWLTPFALASRRYAWLVWVSVSPLAYAFYASNDDIPWTRALEYGAVGAALLAQLARKRASERNG